MKKFLFPKGLYESNGLSFVVLALRLVFGILLMTHGYQKLCNFSTLADGAFPDPLGVGSGLSVSLAIFGEFFCSLAFIFGFLYRLSMIPMIFTMFVAFTFAHGFSIANGGELALVYMVAFIGLYLLGPGKFSLDYLISRRISR